MRTKKLAKRFERRDASFISSFGFPQQMENPSIVSKRIENMREDVKKFLNVAKDVDKCQVGKTSDTGSYVITLIDSKDNQVSLWLFKDGRVRTITPY